MTKEQAFSAAEKLLLHIYGDDVMICAKICTASADRDRNYLTSSLDEIIKFCEQLKKTMWGK